MHEIKLDRRSSVPLREVSLLPMQVRSGLGIGTRKEQKANGGGALVVRGLLAFAFNSAQERRTRNRHIAVPQDVVVPRRPSGLLIIALGGKRFDGGM